MSTGANCSFREHTPGQWFYHLQRYPYGATEDYDVEGPFATFAAAYDHLHRNNANPGGYWVEALPDCPHDLKRQIEHRIDPYRFTCDRCGDHLLEA